jgi:hypothetical protein
MNRNLGRALFKAVQTTMLGIMVHSCNASTQAAETEGSQVQGQIELPNEFEASLDYTARPCLKNKKIF